MEFFKIFHLFFQNILISTPVLLSVSFQGHSAILLVFQSLPMVHQTFGGRGRCLFIFLSHMVSAYFTDIKDVVTHISFLIFCVVAALFSHVFYFPTSPKQIGNIFTYQRTGQLLTDIHQWYQIFWEKTGLLSSRKIILLKWCWVK